MPCSAPLPVNPLREGPQGHASGPLLFPAGFSSTLATQVAPQTARCMVAQPDLTTHLNTVPTRTLHHSVEPSLGKSTKPRPGVSTQNPQGCWQSREDMTRQMGSAGNVFFVENKMAGGGLGTTLLRDVGDQERGAGLKGTDFLLH